MDYTQICNLALGSLGHDRVVDDYDGKTDGVFNDQSTEAVRCRLFLPVALEQTLGAHDWNWAAAEDPVSLGHPADGAWCVVETPADAARIVGVFLRGPSVEKVETRMANGVLMVRAVPGRRAFIRYVPRDVAPEDTPWWFRDALVHRLAELLAGPMFGDDAKSANAAQTATRSLSQAFLMDDSVSARPGRCENPLIAARR